MTTHRRKHDRHTPRGWFSLFIRMGGWLAIIAAGVLFVLTLISATQLFLADQLDRQGRFARAVVLEKTIRQSRDADGDTQTSYFVTFKFKATGGGREVERQVGAAYFDEVETEDEVQIRYLRSDPEVIEHEMGSYRRTGNAFRWVALLFGVAGLFALWRFGGEANRAILTRRDGEKRLAQVTAILEANVEVNGRRQARLQWREEDGQTGESLMRDVWKLSRLYKAGDTVVVFRLGDECVWEGDVGPPKREMPGA